jgi:glycosyltransferase involved in cell wall biosynthesis
MYYEKEIIQLGGRIFRAPAFKGLNLFQYKNWWRVFLTEHPQYKIVHGHIGSLAAIYLGIANKMGRFTIAHSHATKGYLSVQEIIFRLMSYPTRYVARFFFGCSIQAGIDRYGKGIARSTRFRVINNGIDAEKYRYSKDVRTQCRTELGVGEKTIVCGHIGRFVPEKNHQKILKVFKEVHKINPDSVLLLFGAGPEKKTIENLANECGLLSCIRFMGLTNRVNYYLMGMDVFIFPSIFEGLGISLVEAQATGLSCIISTAIVDEADIGAGLLTKLPLDLSDKKWAESVVEKSNTKRADTLQNVIDSGFDISSVATELESFYKSHN